VFNTISMSDDITTGGINGTGKANSSGALEY
jgi:hypothetical protein